MINARVGMVAGSNMSQSTQKAITSNSSTGQPGSRQQLEYCDKHGSHLGSIIVVSKGRVRFVISIIHRVPIRIHVLNNVQYIIICNSYMAWLAQIDGTETCTRMFLEVELELASHDQDFALL